MHKILCPFCSATVIEQPEWITSYYDPKFTCRKCKKSGKISWSAEEKTNVKAAKVRK